MASVLAMLRGEKYLDLSDQIAEAYKRIAFEEAEHAASSRNE